MSVRKAQNTVRMQLELVELVINAGWNYQDPYFLKWKRHYLLKRLLTLQLKEFDNDNAG